MKNKFHSGFTVLEFLIVVAIIVILIAIILPNLQLARERSLDEKRVTDLKTISLGLEQFKQACGSYPSNVTPLTECMSNISITLGQYIPEISQYNFTDSTNPGYIQYAPLAINATDSECVAFHLGIKLKNTTATGIFSVNDANIDSGSSISGYTYYPCSGGQGLTFDGNEINTYDIFKQ